MLTQPQAGQRVREISTGREGEIDFVSWDSSCGDPECCGGPEGNVVYVKFDNGYYDSFMDQDEFSNSGEWPQLELIAL